MSAHDADFSRADLRGADAHGVDLRATRFCVRDADQTSPSRCRPVTRTELIDVAHAGLAEALAPS